MHEGHRERLRETYLNNGVSALHDHQLLELLLTLPFRGVIPTRLRIACLQHMVRWNRCLQPTPMT